MDSIRIQNLRCLKDTKKVKISPLTMLVGQNSSGKSSFLRVFPLLRQSVETRTTGPILWYGRFVDFGGFSEAVTKSSSEQEIAFQFKFKYPNISNKIDSRHRRKIPFINDNPIVNVTLVVSSDSKQGKTRAKRVEAKIAGQVISLSFDSDGKVASFKVNDLDVLKISSGYWYVQSGHFIPWIYQPELADQDIVAINRKNELYEYLIRQVKNIAHHKTSDESIRYIATTLGLGSTSAMLSNFANNRYAGETWAKKIKTFDKDSSSFKALREAVIAYWALEIIKGCDQYICEFANNVKYIGPVRATAERYYRMQDLAVDEIDFQGRNIAMFFHNLSEHERKSFAEWTREYFGFSPYVQTTTGHFSIKLKNVEGGTDYNLADMGFGFSQILPIIVQLWVLTSRKQRRTRSVAPTVFAIEQPELHLHPKMQAQIADSFLAAINAAKRIGVDIRIIIENHSDIIINRVGHRVANQDIKKEDINVVVFNKSLEDDHTYVSTSSYDEQGFLDKWPSGFFDPEII